MYNECATLFCGSQSKKPTADFFVESHGIL